jgi:DNA (cytosine-5)-methyltransferase 1
MNKSRKLTAVDLFCGCGGTSEGLKQAGFKVIAAIDNDPRVAETYKANHPEAYFWQEDIQSLSIHTFTRRLCLKKGDLDLLAGCPPCQGFSTMRTLNGSRCINDPRNDLVHVFQEFVEKLSPKAVMLENVPGLAEDRRFASFCRSLKKLGYIGDHRILNAEDYGVPQRRRRLIYLAGRGFKIPFGQASLEKKTVRDAIGDLPKAGESGDPVHDIPERHSEKILKLIKKIPKDGGSRTALPEEYQLECHKKCNGFKDVYGRMAWDKPAPTLTSGCFNPSKGRFLHPEEDRAITMREAALLQGFPPKYKFPCPSKIKIALMIGNALPPELIKHQSVMIREAIKLN